MKFTFKMLSFLFLTISLPALAQDKPLTDAEQVAGLQKMCADNGEAMKQRQAQKSLYERLGKRQRIQVLSKKILAAHSANPKIGHMFAHVNKAQFVKHVTEFLVVGTGGTAKYTGKDMGTVHRSLHITNADFLAAGGDVNGVMKAMKYGENETQEVVCALVSFVPVVVVQQ
jgi:truncated hemoglobin YjbI